MRKSAWLFAALACALAAAILLSQQRQLAQLRAQNLSLREQLQQLQLLENQHPSNTIPQSDNPAPNSELLRLRAEVTMLHQQTNELARSLQENRRLEAAALARQSPAAYESNALLTTLLQQDPDALLHGTLTPANEPGRIGWVYKGTNAGRQIWSIRAGPTN